MNYLRHQSPALLLAVLLLPGPVMGQAEESERWFQVEVSVFSNERLADREEEVWSPERIALAYPANLQPLRSLLAVLMTATLQPAGSAPESGRSLQSAAALSEPPVTPAAEASAQDIRREIIATTGPFPPENGDGYRFPDFARDAFLQLPASESDFLQTNRALERSPEHRLLFHSVWRQPVPDPGAELPVAISGGDRYGEHWELEGSLSLHFNANRDRVVVDSNLWLTEFTTARAPLPGQAPGSATAAIGNPDPGTTTELQQQEPGWQLPDLPSQLTAAVMAIAPTAAPANQSQDQFATTAPDYEPRIIYHLEQSREMRSNEFHYLDHPALGLIVTVFPYQVPALPEIPVDQDAPPQLQ